MKIYTLSAFPNWGFLTSIKKLIELSPKENDSSNWNSQFQFSIPISPQDHT